MGATLWASVWGQGLPADAVLPPTGSRRTQQRATGAGEGVEGGEGVRRACAGVGWGRLHFLVRSSKGLDMKPYKQGRPDPHSRTVRP